MRETVQTREWRAAMAGLSARPSDKAPVLRDISQKDVPGLTRPFLPLPGRGKCHILRAIDERRKMGGAAAIGVKPRDQVAMRGADGRLVGIGFKPKDLIRLLLSHFAPSPPAAAPRIRVELHVLTPSGRPAIEFWRE
jgi:hypothetical protein